MKYALIHGSRVVETTTIPFDVADPLHWVPCADSVTPEYTFDAASGQFLKAIPVATVSTPVTQLPPLAFLERFTQAEQLGITAAAMQSPAVRLWYDKMLAARFIDLLDVRVAQGLDALIAAGLLAPTRKGPLLTPAGSIPVTIL